MWLPLTALVLTAGPAPDSAEGVFQKMEQALLKSKTFRTDLDVTATAGGTPVGSLKGNVIAGSGNMLRLELEGDVRGQVNKLILVSDGTRMRMTSMDRPAQNQDAKKHFGSMVRSSIARTGIFLAIFAVVPEGEKAPETFDPQKSFPVSDLKLGKKEKIGEKEAQALEYTVKMAGQNQAYSATVWIDEKTGLPVKRVVQFKEGTRPVTVTETYGKLALDEKVDEKQFMLGN